MEWVWCSPAPSTVTGRRRDVPARAAAGQRPRGPPGVGHQAAVQQVQGPGDGPAGEHVLHRQRLAHQRPRVEGGPAPGGDGDLGQLLPGGAVAVHVPRAGQGVGPDRRRQTERGLELGLVDAVEGAHRRPHARAPALPVADQGHPAAPAGHGQRGVAQVEHEGRPADVRAVAVARGDAQVLAQLGRRQAGGKETVNLGLLDPGLGQRVAAGLGVQLEGRLVGQDADLVRLADADDAGRRQPRGPPAT